MHFWVVAILNPPPSSMPLDEHLSKALEPFRDVEHSIPVEHECLNCFYHRRYDMENQARSEADMRFGTASELVRRFEATGAQRPELPTLADSDREAEAKWHEYEEWAKNWKQFIQSRLDWEQARTAELIGGLKADPRCKACHGTGVVLFEWEFRKWDYWCIPVEKSLRGLWQKAVQLHPGVEAEFSQDLVELHGYFEDQAVSGRITRYLVRHESECITSAVLTSDGTWHESQPGVWGIAHLEDKSFPIYGEDEFWPLRFRSIIEEQVQDNQVCIIADCHT